MSIGNYLSSRPHNEIIEKERKKEEWSIDNLTEEGKEMIREIYRNKGFKDELLEDLVKVITSKRKIEVDTMMREEIGIIDDKKNSTKDCHNHFYCF
ncbi:MAG: VIT1/CCC1 transporter family protein [Nitrososphaeraceae archaeon]